MKVQGWGWEVSVEVSASMGSRLEFERCWKLVDRIVGDETGRKGNTIVTAAKSGSGKRSPGFVHCGGLGLFEKGLKFRYASAVLSVGLHIYVNMSISRIISTEVNQGMHL